MLEMILLVWLYRALGRVAKGKGLSPRVGLLGVALWLGCEIGGLGVGIALGKPELIAYGYGLGAAVAGALLSYGIVFALPNAREAEGAPTRF